MNAGALKTDSIVVLPTIKQFTHAVDVIGQMAADKPDVQVEVATLDITNAY